MDATAVHQLTTEAGFPVYDITMATISLTELVGLPRQVSGGTVTIPTWMNETPLPEEHDA